MKKINKAWIFVISLVLVIIYIMIPYPNVMLESDDKDTIDHYMDSKMDELRIKGISLSLIDDKDVYQQGYGEANSKGDLMTPQTICLLGSTTKSITALAIMQLVDEGKLDLDEKVIKYLPDFKMADAQHSSKITIRQLLNQTSGIPASTGGSDYLNKDATASDFVNNLKAYSLQPSDNFDYAEANYVVLGEIIEHITNLSYGDYVKGHIFEPLQMDHTSISKEAASDNGLSNGYRTWFGYPVKVDLPYPKQYASASAIYSSAADLTKYVSLYLNDGIYNNQKIITTDSLENIIQPSIQLKHPVGYAYGMGWFVNEDYVTHDGRPTNYYSIILIKPRTHQAVILLANTNNRLVTAEYIMPMAFEIMNAMNGEKSATTFFGYRQMYRLLNVFLLLLLSLPIYRLVSWIFKRRKSDESTIKSKLGFMLDFGYAGIIALLLGWMLKFYAVSLSIAYLGQLTLLVYCS